MESKLTEEEKSFIGSLSALLKRYDVTIAWNDLIEQYVLVNETGTITLSSRIEVLVD